MLSKFLVDASDKVSDLFQEVFSFSRRFSYEASDAEVDEAMMPAAIRTVRGDRAAELGSLGYDTVSRGGGAVELAYDDFEYGWGHYVTVGGDCFRYTQGTHSPQGLASINIQDNSGKASTFRLANVINISAFSRLTVAFSFKAVAMENGEDFWLQYFDGSRWITVADYDAGSDFVNDTYYVSTVTLTKGPYVFPSNMRIRFRCDASGNYDDVFIDTILITAE